MAEPGRWETMFSSSKDFRADLGTLPLRKAVGLPSWEDRDESLAKEEHAAAEDTFGGQGFYVKSTRSRLALEMEGSGYVYRCSYLPDEKIVRVRSTWSKPSWWWLLLALVLVMGSALLNPEILVLILIVLLIERVISYVQFREAAAGGQREIMLHLNAKGVLVKEEK